MVIIALHALFADSIRTLSELFYWVFCCLYTFPISPAITVYFSNTFCCYLLLRSVYLFCTFVCFFTTWGSCTSATAHIWTRVCYGTHIYFARLSIFCTTWWFCTSYIFARFGDLHYFYRAHWKGCLFLPFAKCGMFQAAGVKCLQCQLLFTNLKSAILMSFNFSAAPRN